MKAPSVVLVRRMVRNTNRKPATYWALRWPGSDGKTRQQNIGRIDEMTEQQAGEIRRQKMIDLGIGKAVRDPVRMTLAEFLEADRIAITSRMSSSTLADHRTASGHAIAAIGGEVRLDRVGWQHVSALASWLGDDHEINGRTMPPCSRATVRKTIVTLKAAFNRAIKRGLIVKNPFAGEKLAKVQSRQKRIFTVEEIEAMVVTAPNAWWTALVRLGFTTGLRLGEMMALTWADVDEDNMQVIVSAKRAGPDRLEWSAKSHTERRVPLCPETAEALLPLKLRGGGSPYVFLDRQRLDMLLTLQKKRTLVRASHWMNNMPRDFGVIQKRARAMLAKQRKVRVEWVHGTLHDLRRSYGTHMAKVVSMNDLRGLMGHASITTTADFYLGISDDLAAKVRTAFSRTA